MSIAAYKQTITETEDPRRLERRVVAQITMALEKNAAAPAESRDLKHALLRNQRLWNTFRVDAMVDGNQLSAALRASIIRSDEHRVGKELVSQCLSRGSTNCSKK